MFSNVPFDLERIILGCGNFGGVGSLPELKEMGDSETEAIALLDQARALGIYQFDTANSYAGGMSESILGRWLRKQEPHFQQEAFVTTKVGNPYGSRTGYNPCSFLEIQFQLDQSLERLGVDQIGLYYLHEMPDEGFALEALEAMSQGIRSGKIGSFGVSNVTFAGLKKLILTAGDSLALKLTHVQNEFHYLQTEDLVELIPFLKSKGIQYSAFSPLAGGLLTGKYQLNQPLPQGSRLAVRVAPYNRYLNQNSFERIKQFSEEARAKNLDLPEAALRFVLNTDGVTSAVIGPRKKEHYESLGLR